MFDFDCKLTVTNKLIPYLMTDPENIRSITLADIAGKGNMKDAFNEIQSLICYISLSFIIYHI